MTRLLALDFRPRRRAGSWLGAVILIAGLVTAVAAAEHYRALEIERDALEAGMNERTRLKPAARGGDTAASQAALQRRHDARRAVVRALGRPWDALFSDIESMPAEDVALLAVEPDPRRGQVRVSGEARDAQALYRYIAALESTDSLDKVGLTQHEILGEGAVAGALRFVLIAHWQGVRN